MHAAGTFLVVDHQFVVFHPHAVGGAKIDDFFLDVKCTPVTTGMSTAIGCNLAADIGLDRFLINADIISPGSDKRHVRTGNGCHTAVRTSVKFKFEFVRKCRTMQLILIFLGEMVAKSLGIITGIFTTGLTDTVRRCSQVGTGATQILVDIVGHFIKDFFQLGSCGTEKNDITGGTMHVGDTAAAEIPQITELSQIFGGIKFSSRADLHAWYGNVPRPGTFWADHNSDR